MARCGRHMRTRSASKGKMPVGVKGRKWPSVGSIGLDGEEDEQDEGVHHASTDVVNDIWVFS